MIGFVVETNIIFRASGCTRLFEHVSIHGFISSCFLLPRAPRAASLPNSFLEGLHRGVVLHIIDVSLPASTHR